MAEPGEDSGDADELNESEVEDRRQSCSLGGGGGGSGGCKLRRRCNACEHVTF